jgi:hypothetical protein
MPESKSCFQHWLVYSASLDLIEVGFHSLVEPLVTAG